MVFGSGETMEQRIRHLELLRQLQEETGGFTAFVPSSFRPQSRQPGWEEATAVEYLKTMAIARMVLDNIENMQADWTAQGLKVLQMGLRFGSNDVGSVQLKAKPATTEEELRRVIRDAGFRPVQRDTVYRTMFLN
jgi:cyclic dehypoxanthinyl futalosine synthase